MSKRLADECDKNCMSVTNDLAIAKFALSIQSEESPKFEIIFIQLGSFHIELSFFKVVGKFIADSSVPYILPESLALTEGLMNAFLSGNTTVEVKMST